MGDTHSTPSAQNPCLYYSWGLKLGCDRRNIREIKKDKSGKLISINVLKYTTILLNFAASLVAIENLKKDELLQHEHLVVLIRADNMSDDSWTRKASSSSMAGKALMRLQC
eukprot:3815904-Ditylum_brightwellii.AAC.1